MKKIYLLSIFLFTGFILLSGCSVSENDFEEKNFTVQEAMITELQIDLKDRKIELEPSKDGQIHITYYDSSKEFYEIATSEHTLVMTGKNDKEWTDYIGKNASLNFRTVRLQIPQKGLASLDLKTSNEDILLPALHFSDRVSINVNNGNIKVEQLDVGKEIKLISKNGNINGVIAGSYDDFSISCEVKKGETNLPKTKDNGEKSLVVSVNNGDIDILFEKEKSPA